ncbi:MAG: hypothetical protein GW941_00005 [Candidatus Pacebacteria bacterium]|nr:hypothetical protein [Candidatus Paceibacterota bacterium]
MKNKKRFLNKDIIFKLILNLFFSVWLITMGVFSGFLFFGLNQEPNYSDSIIHIFQIVILTGVISFLCLWLLGLISLFSKKLRDFTFRALATSLMVIVIWLIIVFIVTNVFSNYIKENNSEQFPIQQSLRSEPMTEDIQDLPSPTPSPSPSSTPTFKPVDPYANDKYLKDAQWGDAVEIDSGSYTMKVGMDPQMSTPNELYEALMAYRDVKGKSRLTWDDRLASYANERAIYICEVGSDHHAGFSQYLEDGGYEKLGFRHLGENMSYGMRLSGVHLIEWIYSKSPGHEANQIGPWSHIGVGISGNCSVLIFGDFKM